MSWIFEPSHFIDRNEEQELFDRLVELEEEVRLLAIRDDSNKGKSQLLKALRWRCQFRDPPVPVSLVPFDEIEHKNAHYLVQSFESSLRGFGLEFEHFRAVEDERTTQRLGTIGSVQAGTMSGGTATGVHIDPGGVMVVNAPGEIEPDAQERLKARAVEAFLDDLEEVCRDRPVVLLLDAYEECGQDLEQWIPQTFLRRHLFDPDRRLEQLIVVIAGRRVPTVGLQRMFGDRFGQVVKSLEALSIWEREHVKEYLELTGITGYDEADVNYIYEKLQAGMPIGTAVNRIQQWMRTDGGE